MAECDPPSSSSSSTAAAASSSSTATSLSLVVKWSGQEYMFDDSCLDCDQTVYDLKSWIYEQTGVHPDRQKLIGLKNNKGKPAEDLNRLDELNLKPNSKIMMVGTKEVDIENVNNDDLLAHNSSVVNDLDIPDEVEIPIANREEYLAKIEKRIKEYKVTIFNEPRPGKKLLVLDIDYTLFDHRSVAEHASQLMRPFLHEFLTSAYEDYDIIIWSATGMKWIEVKMRELGVANNPNYKIVCYLDSMAMISVNIPNHGILNIKPLGVIWGKYNQYTPKNTIMFDDVRRNFIMNPQSGLKIRAFREAHKNQKKDKELYYLTKYLKKIAKLDDFSSLNHKHWQSFINS